MIIQGKFVSLSPKDRKNYFHLSVSKLKTFKQCKAKYHFDYIQHLPKKDKDFLTFGSFVHEVLELFEKMIIAGNKEPHHILMKKCFAEALKNWKNITQDQKKESFDILCAFLKKRSSDCYIPLAAEKEFSIDIGNTVLLNGFIDLVKEEQGLIHVIDYKSSKQTKYLKKDPLQLLTYAYVMCLENEKLDKVKSSYVMLKFDFEEITFEFSREEALGIEKQFRDHYVEINDEKLFRPTTGPLCEYCDFSEHCPNGLEWIRKAEERKNKKNTDNNFGEREW